MPAKSNVRFATLGDLARHRRLALGLTQEEIAARLGVDQTWVSNIEKDKYKSLPAPARLRALAHALRLSLPELLAQLGYTDEEPVLAAEPDEVVYANLAAEAERLSEPLLREQLLSTIGFLRRLSAGERD